MPWTKVCLKTFPIKISFFTISFVFHRFGETEGIAVLAMFVSQYKITIKEEPQFASETFEERKSRILSASLGLTLTYVFQQSFFLSNISGLIKILDLFLLRPTRVPLTLTRR